MGPRFINSICWPCTKNHALKAPMWQQILAFGDHQGWIWMAVDIEKGQTMMQYIEQWSEDLRKLFHTMLNPCLIISGNVCCLISTLIICSLMFLNQCHSLRIVLLVKANLAYLVIPFSLSGNLNLSIIGVGDTALFKKNAYFVWMNILDFEKMDILFEWIFWILKKWIFCLNEYSGF